MRDALEKAMNAMRDLMRWGDKDDEGNICKDIITIDDVILLLWRNINATLQDCIFYMMLYFVSCWVAFLNEV